MNTALWNVGPRRVRRGAVPVWTGHGWEPLQFAGARVINSLGQTVATATVTTLTFDVEQWDTHGFHDGQTNTNRLTVPYGMGGVYRIGANVQWVTNMGCNRMILGLRVNTSTEIGAVEMAGVGTPDTPAQAVATIWKLVDGDFVDVYAYQDTGSNKSVSYVDGRSPVLWFYRVAPIAER